MTGHASDAIRSLRGNAQQAVDGPGVEAFHGEIETFYPVTNTSDDRSTALADVRDSATGGLHTHCEVLSTSFGDVSYLPEETPVVVARLGSLGECVIHVRYTEESPSPTIEAGERRIRVGEMTLEFTTDSEGRQVIRHGHQLTDGEGYDASYIVRGDGSIEGHAGTVGFCFHSDGSYYYSGLGSYIVGGTPGEGAPETAAGDQETTGIATDGSTTSLAQSTTAEAN